MKKPAQTKETADLPKQETGTLAETFRRARSRAVPLIGVETPDPASSVRQCIAALNGSSDKTVVATWDISRGVTGSNAPGETFVTNIPEDTRMQLRNPAEFLSWLAANAPAKGLFFFSNASRFYDSPDVLQGVWNLRDTLKASGATLVLLSPMLKLPPELSRDVALITEALPDTEQITAIVNSITQDAKANCDTFVLPDDTTKPVIIDTLLGLSAFEAEQALALSLTKTGISQPQLWDRKVKAIEATEGLSVYKGKEKFSDVGGILNAKKIMGSTITGKLGLRCVILLDELDKSFSAATDTSGTTQDQNKVLLSYMQDNDVPGMLFLGPPGTAKTLITKSAANEHNIPLVMLDLGAMKGSLVGQSEQRLRQAIKIIHAISNGKALFVGCCNRSESLPPELRRRFNYASIFYDLPDTDERNSIWKVWRNRYSLTPDQCDSIDDTGYTGAEIKNCCLKAWAMDCTLSEAAKTIVPISKSAADVVEGLRKSASGKYVSASHAGLYTYSPAGQSAARKIEL